MLYIRKEKPSKSFIEFNLGSAVRNISIATNPMSTKWLISCFYVPIASTKKKSEKILVLSVFKCQTLIWMKSGGVE